MKITDFRKDFLLNLEDEINNRSVAAREARDKWWANSNRNVYKDEEERIKRERALIARAFDNIHALTNSSHMPNSPTPVYHHAGFDQESLYHYEYYEPGMIMRRNFYTDFIRQYIDRQPMDLRNVHRILVVARNVLPDNTSDFNDALLGRRTKKHRGESSNA